MESFLAGRATVVKLPPAGNKSAASGGGGFSPMFAEKKAEPTAVPASVPAAANAMPTTPVSPVAQPVPHVHSVSVELVRVDGAVQGIVVTCKCGERIELDCVY